MAIVSPCVAVSGLLAICPKLTSRVAILHRLFAQAEVDLAALCLLNNQDLLDIGVLPLGARKKLLHAMEMLPPEAASLFACVS